MPISASDLFGKASFGGVDGGGWKLLRLESRPGGFGGGGGGVAGFP